MPYIYKGYDCDLVDEGLALQSWNIINNVLNINDGPHQYPTKNKANIPLSIQWAWFKYRYYSPHAPQPKPRAFIPGDKRFALTVFLYGNNAGSWANLYNLWARPHYDRHDRYRIAGLLHDIRHSERTRRTLTYFDMSTSHSMYITTPRTYVNNFNLYRPIQPYLPSVPRTGGLIIRDPIPVDDPFWQRPELTDRTYSRYGLRGLIPVDSPLWNLFPHRRYTYLKRRHHRPGRSLTIVPHRRRVSSPARGPPVRSAAQRISRILSLADRAPHYVVPEGHLLGTAVPHYYRWVQSRRRRGRPRQVISQDRADEYARAVTDVQDPMWQHPTLLHPRPKRSDSSLVSDLDDLASQQLAIRDPQRILSEEEAEEKYSLPPPSYVEMPDIDLDAYRRVILADPNFGRWTGQTRRSQRIAGPSASDPNDPRHRIPTAPAVPPPPPPIPPSPEMPFPSIGSYRGAPSPTFDFSIVPHAALPPDRPPIPREWLPLPPEEREELRVFPPPPPPRVGPPTIEELAAEIEEGSTPPPDLLDLRDLAPTEVISPPVMSPPPRSPTELISPLLPEESGRTTVEYPDVPYPPPTFVPRFPFPPSTFGVGRTYAVSRRSRPRSLAEDIDRIKRRSQGIVIDRLARLPSARVRSHARYNLRHRSKPPSRYEP